MESKHIIIIGGGASGFFAAINCAIHHPQAVITILEKTNKILSKVRVSGGGRCNVTHHCFENNVLIKNYPRGEKELQQVFAQFNVTDTIEWFKLRGVKLKVEADGRMFPESNSSETIINCFLQEAQKFNITIKLSEEVVDIENKNSTQLVVRTNKQNYVANSVIFAIVVHHQLKNYSCLQQSKHRIDELIPSLFTLNLPQSNINELMGLSVKNATVKVNGTKFQFTGPLLITHWGLSGPAILKLSAYAAEYFYKNNYHVGISVNWSGSLNEAELKSLIEFNLTSKALIANSTLFEIPKRLWEFLLQRAEIPLSKPWIELGKKQLQKLVQVLTNDAYPMQGKTTFKEEFVTAGGINLKEITFKTMESKLVPHLFFCGEVLNIDGITGGFNFQNAWSTAWIASKLGE